MDLSTEPDIYQPHMSPDGDYIDYIPSPAVFKNGLRCSCGTRKDHVFTSKYNFTIHVKSKVHQKWLLDLNHNKMNYFTEYVKLSELVNTQKMIIAHLEKELTVKISTIAYLTVQLEQEKEKPIDLLTFDWRGEGRGEKGEKL